MKSSPKAPSRLFRKYMVLFVSLVGGALLTNGIIEIYFSYQKNKTALIHIQREKARAAALSIEYFIERIERQVEWIACSPWAARLTLDRRRLEFIRLLHQIPSLTEVAYLDASGAEQLRVSRLTINIIGSNLDFSNDPKFLEVKSEKTYFGPVYFRKGSEPFMTISIAGRERNAGITVAEVNLKFIWDVVSQIKFGKAGRAYTVDSIGNVIAHSDISIVLKKTNFSSLPHIKKARSNDPEVNDKLGKDSVASNFQGLKVLTTHANIKPLGWLVFLEQPLTEAFEPLYVSIFQTGLLIIAGITLSIFASMVLARKMVRPIRTLQDGAVRIGAGDLGYRLHVRTGDELEILADEFNRMTTHLQESYSHLEKKIEERTHELTEALKQQTAISEFLELISGSTFVLEPLLESLIKNAARLAEAQKGFIFILEKKGYHLAADYGASTELKTFFQNNSNPAAQDTLAGRVVLECRSILIPDALIDPQYRLAKAQRLGEGRTMLGVPILKGNVPIGVIELWRNEVKPFSQKQIELVETFADGVEIAIENVRLFQELETRSHELARSVEELRVLGEVGQTVSSTLDLKMVLATIVAHAVDLSGTDAGAIYEFEETSQKFQLRATHRMSKEFVQTIEKVGIRLGETVVGRAGLNRKVVEVQDILDEPANILRNAVLQAGFRSLLAVPLLLEEKIIGALVVRRKIPGHFEKESVDLLQNFAAQSALAIQNARLFKEIEAKGYELEIASKHKSEFLAKMSHELRTPLNAIIGYSEMLMEDAVGLGHDGFVSDLERINGAGKHLLVLINDILDLSKIEAGKIEIYLETIDIKNLIEDVISTIKPLVEKNDNFLKYNITDNIGQMHADLIKVRQTLFNLLSNACKFTEQGIISLRVYRKSINNSEWIVFTVKDNGIGMKKEQMDKLFQAFIQADISTTRKYGGTGLGLAISKHFCQMMGGDIIVESEIGVGSTFTVRIPIKVVLRNTETPSVSEFQTEAT